MAQRICMIVYNYYPFDVRVRREVNALTRRGCSVDVICARREGESRLEVSGTGCKIFRLPVTKIRGDSAIGHLYAYAVFLFLSAITVSWLSFRRPYRIVQVHTLPDILVFSAIVPKLLGSKLILDLHEIMPEFFASKYKLRRNHPLVQVLALLERASIRFADRIITINEPIRDIFVRRDSPKSRVVVVMNAVDEDDFPRFPRVPHDGFRLMYHGSLMDLYGVDLVLEALSSMDDRLSGIEFHIFGEGPQKQELAALTERLHLKDIVFLHGLVSVGEICSNMSNMDVGVVSIRRDEFVDLSFSNKLAEYIYSGVPVIATRLSSTLRYFDEHAVCYFDSEDVGDLASKITELRRDPSKGLHQAKEAFEQYQRINWAVMRERYWELVGSLMNE